MIKRLDCITLLVCCMMVWGCKPHVKSQKLKYSYLSTNLMLNYCTPMVSLDSVFFIDEYSDTVELSELSNQLFFIYSDMNCLTCVETVLRIIPDEFPELLDQLVVVSSYESLRNLFVFKRVNKYDGKIYNDYSGVFTNSFNTKYLPALFFIHPNGKVYNYLWADKSQKEFLRTYLKTIKKQIIHNEK